LKGLETFPVIVRADRAGRLLPRECVKSTCRAAMFQATAPCHRLAVRVRGRLPGRAGLGKNFRLTI
jgi:hypothetical protein